MPPLILHLELSWKEPGRGSVQLGARAGFITVLMLMFSFQPQHSHLVIQQLLGHLDANSKSAATVRAGIVEVLSEAAVIAASGSVGKRISFPSPSISSPFYCGGSGEGVPAVWAGLCCVPRCELEHPVWSTQGCWGSLGCRFSAPKRNTHPQVK